MFSKLLTCNVTERTLCISMYTKLTIENFYGKKNCDMNGLEQPYGRNILRVVEAHDGFYVLDHDLLFLLITPS